MEEEMQSKRVMGHFMDFMNAPFRGASDMDAIDWFMFIGLILIIMILWNIILKHIAEAI